ncbi:MAG TPA: twin-arginine translocase TatA/TatE family subunit [Polyangia bacterium]
MFNLGFGELAVLTIIAVLLFGNVKLPDLVTLVRPPSTPASSRWSRSDWLLVCAAVLAGGFALSLLSVPRH